MDNRRDRPAQGLLAVLWTIVAGIGTTFATPPVVTPYIVPSGTTRDYLNIVEASAEGNPFGAPVIVGDTLLFEPQNFISESDFLLGGSDITDSQLRFSVDAHPGQTIDTIYFRESGVYTLSGGGGVGGFALASVATPIFYHVREIDGVATDGPKGVVLMLFTPSDGMFSLDSDGPGVNVPWEGELLLDIASIIAADPNFSGRATLVEITLDNTLGTVNVPGQPDGGGEPDGYYALIRKNRLQITVPEYPAGMWIGLFAVAAFCVGRQNRFAFAMRGQG